MSARDVILQAIRANWIKNDTSPVSETDAILSALNDAGYAVVPKAEARIPDNVSAWVMHDNHTFSELDAKSVQGLVTEALRIHAEHKDCMLCPVTVLSGKKELRRVGPSVHLYSKDFAKDLSEWIAQVSSDPDITRLLTAAKETP